MSHRVEFWCRECGVIETLDPDDPAAFNQPGPCPECARTLVFRIASGSEPEAEPRH